MPDDPEAPPLIPAATVVLLRDGAEGLEALMVQRSRAVTFAGGHWVFPGGRVDDTDVDPDRPDDELAAARRAAVREAAEETGLVVDPDALVPFAHWTPPAVTIKRYGTWFFATAIDEHDPDVTVDGGEITGHQWSRPADMIRQRDELAVELSPPTWITLHGLAGQPDTATALAALDAAEPERFATRFATVEGGIVALYHGDSGYDDEVPDRPGPRHRLWMLDRWRYERDA